MALRVLKTTQADSNLSQRIFGQWRAEIEKALFNGEAEKIKNLIMALREIVDFYPDWKVYLDHYTGRLALLRGSYQNAALFFERQLSHATTRSMQEEAADAQVWLAEALLWDSQNARAQDLLTVARDYSRKHNLFLPYLRAQTRIGLLHHNLGAYDSCRRYLEVEVSRLLRMLDKRVLETSMLAQVEVEEALAAYWLGRNYLAERELSKAAGSLDKALYLYRLHNHRPGIAITLLQAGITQFGQENYSEALNRFEECDKLLVVLPGAEAAVELFFYISKTYAELGESWKSYMAGRRTMSAANRMQDTGWLARAHYVLGQSQMKVGESPAGHTNLLRAAEMYPRSERDSRWISLIIELGDYLHSLPESPARWEESLELYKLAGAIIQDSQRFEYLAPSLGKMARAFLKIRGVNGAAEAEELYKLQLRLAGDLESQVLPIPVAVQLRVEALTGIQCCASLRIREEKALRA
jgi:tetratricopeptide (TPR) repeat protein